MVQPACAFPPCPEFGVVTGAPGRRFCGSCKRPLSGPTFGPGRGYRLDALLGSGYYADVFGVVDVASGASYAAKMYASEPPKRAAALRETEALRALSHARLPAFRETFEEGEWRFVVMELVAGTNLRQAVETRGPLAVERVITLGLDICELFEYIASKRWTYRDLHPKNIHPDTPKGAMLLDLDGARPEHWPAQPAGRMGYRAPELKRKGEVSPACDVYSLAGCLYFAFTGQDPPARSGRLPDPRGQLKSIPHIAEILDGCRPSDPTRRLSVPALRAEFARMVAP